MESSPLWSGCSSGLRPPDHRLRRFWRRAWEQDECRDNLGGPAKEKDRREAGPTTGELSRIPWDLVLNRLMSGLSQPCRYKKERSDCKVRTHHALASQTISLIKRNRGLWARAKAPLWAVRILLVTKKSGKWAVIQCWSPLVLGLDAWVFSLHLQA